MRYQVQSLLDVMRERGWTQADAAFKCGLSQGELNHLIHGRRRANLETARKIFQGFGLTRAQKITVSKAWTRDLFAECLAWQQECEHDLTEGTNDE